MPAPETPLHRDTVFSGRLFDVHVDRVRLANGAETERHIVEHPGSVVLVPVDGDEVLLVRQYRHAAGRVLLELPAGTLEPGEPVDVTARRELAEEVGRAAERWTHLGTLLISPGFVTETMCFYLAENLRPAYAPADDDEDLEVVHLPWAEAVDRARRAAFDDVKTVAGVLMADAARGRSTAA